MEKHENVYFNAVIRSVFANDAVLNKNLDQYMKLDTNQIMNLYRTSSQIKQKGKHITTVKAIMKNVLTYVKEKFIKKFPLLTYIDPKNINIDLENDEVIALMENVELNNKKRNVWVTMTMNMFNSMISNGFDDLLSSINMNKVIQHVNFDDIKEKVEVPNTVSTDVSNLYSMFGEKSQLLNDTSIDDGIVEFDEKRHGKSLNPEPEELNLEFGPYSHVFGSPQSIEGSPIPPSGDEPFEGANGRDFNMSDSPMNEGSANGVEQLNGDEQLNDDPIEPSFESNPVDLVEPNLSPMKVDVYDQDLVTDPSVLNTTSQEESTSILTASDTLSNTQPPLIISDDEEESPNEIGRVITDVVAVDTNDIVTESIDKTSNLTTDSRSQLNDVGKIKNNILIDEDSDDSLDLDIGNIQKHLMDYNGYKEFNTSELTTLIESSTSSPPSPIPSPNIPPPTSKSTSNKKSSSRKRKDPWQNETTLNGEYNVGVKRKKE